MNRLTRSQRLDRLPLTRRQYKLVWGCGIGWALDAMDIGLISFIMTALKKQWDLGDGQLSLLGAIGPVGMAIGASVGGLIADRIGRRQVFALTLLVYGIATGLSALSAGIIMLIVLRLIVGLGLGAELPVASTLVSEFAPARIRGRVIVILESFWAIGWLAAALVSYFVVPSTHNGWRWALALGAIPAVYAIIVRFSLPESVRFLESKGQNDEAEKIIEAFERDAGISTPEEKKATEKVPIVKKISWFELWKFRFRSTTIALWITWFCINFAYYGAFIWLPTLLNANGMTLVKSFEFTLYMTIAQLPGYFAAAVLIEIWGRRATLVTFLIGSALSSAFFAGAPNIAHMISPDSGAVTYGITLTAGCLLSFFNLGAWGALYAVTPEVYPTNMRATGSGAATAFGRIAAMLAPLCVPLIKAHGNLFTLFIVFGATFFIAAIAAWKLPERKGETLQEI